MKTFFMQIFRNITSKRVKKMYKPTDRMQPSFLDFNQPMGLKMNPENRWIKIAVSIPWDEFE